MAVWSWSKVPINNGTADPTVNWQEGQAPSTLNDSSRSMMARLAEFRDDITGTLSSSTAGGGVSGVNYAITTNGSANSANGGVPWNSTPNNGQIISAKLHATNGASPTLKVDGGTAYPITLATGLTPAAGCMTIGGIYDFIFNSALSTYVVRGFAQQAFTTGDIKPTIKTTADSGWIMLNDLTIGSAGSNATGRANADTLALFTLLYTNVSDNFAPVYSSGAVLGTRVGFGSAATAFGNGVQIRTLYALGNAMMSAGVSSHDSSLGTFALGEFFGTYNHTLTVAEMPQHGHTGISGNAGVTGNDSPDHHHTYTAPGGNTGGVGAGNTATTLPGTATSGANVNHTHSIPSQGGGGAHNITQPSLSVWFMMKL